MIKLLKIYAMLLLCSVVNSGCSDSLEVPENKTLIVIPWGPNGGTDNAVQAVMPYLGDDFVIEYMPGESGRTGLSAVYRSNKPVIGAGAPKAIWTRAVMGQWNYLDWEIYTIWRAPPLLSSSKKTSPITVFKNLKEQGNLTVATAGYGSAGHSAMESLTNADRSIRYEQHEHPSGGRAAVDAAAAGKADLTSQLSTEQLLQIEQGNLHPLAVFLDESLTVNGQSVPPVSNFISEPLPDVTSTFALMVPKINRPMVEKMNAIWDSIPTDLEVDGVQWNIKRGVQAQRLISAEVSAAVWSLARHPDAYKIVKKTPQELGIHAPEL